MHVKSPSSAFYVGMAAGAFTSLFCSNSWCFPLSLACDMLASLALQQQKAKLELCLRLPSIAKLLTPHTVPQARPVVQVWAAQQDPPGESAVAYLGLNRLLILEFAKPSEISS